MAKPFFQGFEIFVASAIVIKMTAVPVGLLIIGIIVTTIILVIIFSIVFDVKIVSGACKITVQAMITGISQESLLVRIASPLLQGLLNICNLIFF